MNNKDKTTKRRFFDTQRDAMEYAHAYGGEWNCFHEGPYWVDEFIEQTPTPKTTRPIDVVSKQYVKHLEERIAFLEQYSMELKEYIRANYHSVESLKVALNMDMPSEADEMFWTDCMDKFKDNALNKDN